MAWFRKLSRPVFPPGFSWWIISGLSFLGLRPAKPYENPFHHSLTRALAANVDVAVVRVANIAMSSALQLTVEFVEHEVGQQWRKWTSLRSAFHTGADQSVLHHPGVQKCPDEFQQPLVFDSFGDLTHQFVVIDSVEKLFEVEINHPAVACGDVLLRLGYRLMCRSSRSKTIAVVGERRVPLPLQHLHHRLLDESIQHRRDAKLSHPAVRFGDFHPPHRLRFVGSTQQLFSDYWPVLFQVVGELDHRDPVHSRATFITLHLPQCFLQVFSITDVLHQSAASSWAFGFTRRHQRFSLFSCDTSGFTRQRRREVQFHLDVLLLVVFETHGLLTAPSRSGLLRCRVLCPMLTSAPRSGCLTATSVAEATRNRSPGVSSVTFRAPSPNLRFAP